MIRRMNYTGRSRIRHKSIFITVHEGEPRTFDAKIDLPDNEFSGDAVVYVEAPSTGSSTVQRFPFGTVEQIQPPPLENRRLTGITGERVIFTIKVVDQREDIGRLLGFAKGIHPVTEGQQEQTGRSPILPVNPVDLGQRVWRVTFADTEVRLDVNRDVSDIKQIARNDWGFFALIYPEVVQRILERVLMVERHDEVTHEHDWRDHWLRFGIAWHPQSEQPPRVQGLPGDPLIDTDRELLDQWIDEVVRGFCDHYETKKRWCEKLAENER